MQFPNAHSGVKKLFLAELFTIGAALLIFVAAILSSFKTDTLAKVASILVLVAGIIMIVALVLQLVGLGQGGKDNDAIKLAFWIVVFTLVLSIVVVILNAFVPAAALVSSIFDIVVRVAEVLALVYTIIGISELAARLGDNEFAEKGKTLIYIICGLILISVILDLIIVIVKPTHNWSITLFSIFAILVAVAELVAYIFYLTYLAHARKVLAK